MPHQERSRSVDLSIIIVNWRSVDYLSACISSIHRLERSVRYEIVVVDNASSDGCAERLSEYEDVKLVQSATNVGFARANNMGVSAATADVLLFLNPDTEVVDGAIGRMYQCFLSLPAVGALGCRLLNSDGSVQTTSVLPIPTVLNQVLGIGSLQRLTPRARLWRAAALLEPDRLSEVEVVSGACMMMRRTVFSRIGGFSAEYFMYGEDVDICYRARAIGLRNYHYGEATIIHHGGGSSRRRPSAFSAVMMRSSIHLFLRRSRGRAVSASYRLAISISAAIRMAVLLALAPVIVAAQGVGWWTGTLRKWSAIAAWGVGLQADVIESNDK